MQSNFRHLINSTINPLFFLILFPLLLTACQSIKNMRVEHEIPDPGPNCQNKQVLHPEASMSWAERKGKLCGAAGLLCRTEATSVVISQQPDISIEDYQNIAFTNITGQAGNAFAAALMEKMVSNSKLNVVDRVQMEKLKKELRLPDEEALFDKDNLIELGKLIPGTLLVIGEVNQDYKEETREVRDTCQDPNNKKKKIDCSKKTRTGRAAIQGEVFVVETKTGKQLSVKRISRSARKETTATDGDPPVINAEALLDKIFNEAVHDVEKSIIPTKEKRTIVFYKDENIPKIKRGIREAKAGDLKASKQYFMNAIDKYRSRDDVSPESLATAYFNLGVLYTYERKHEKAIEMFKKVDDLALDKFQTITMRNTSKCLSNITGKKTP